jgi:hypothetical protein
MALGDANCCAARLGNFQEFPCPELTKNCLAKGTKVRACNGSHFQAARNFTRRAFNLDSCGMRDRACAGSAEPVCQKWKNFQYAHCWHWRDSLGKPSEQVAKTAGLQSGFVV